MSLQALVKLALAALLGQAITPPPTPATSGEVDVEGQVVDVRGTPASLVNVFAVPTGGDRIAGLVTSRADGRFRLHLPHSKYDFGLLSARWLLVGFERTGPREVRLIVRPAFPDADPLRVAQEAKAWAPALVRPAVPRPGVGGAVSATIGRLSGRVVDEAGVPLGGVRLLAVDGRTRHLLSAAETDAKGRYTLVTRAGPNRLFVYAPGLRLEGAWDRGGERELVLAVEAQAENVVIRSGRLLSFDLRDSVYPEIIPPNTVVAALRFDYGIDLAWGVFCPGDLVHALPPSPEESRRGCRLGSCARRGALPATFWERRCKVPKFWWLRLLQMPTPTSGDRLWWEDAIREMQVADEAAEAAKAARGP